MTRKELGIRLSIITVLEPEKGCWFIRGRDWSNYTTIGRKSGHRLVYQLCIGPLIKGKEICHKCDRKGCINPAHLFQGSHSVNMHDAQRKGRSWNHRENKILRDKQDWALGYSPLWIKLDD